MAKTLSEMESTEKGIIKNIVGGKGLSAKMDSLSLYIGKEIELGIKDMFKSVLIMLITAVLAGTLLNQILKLI